MPAPRTKIRRRPAFPKPSEVDAKAKRIKGPAKLPGRSAQHEAATLAQAREKMVGTLTQKLASRGVPRRGEQGPGPAAASLYRRKTKRSKRLRAKGGRAFGLRDGFNTDY